MTGPNTNEADDKRKTVVDSSNTTGENCKTPPPEKKQTSNEPEIQQTSQSANNSQSSTTSGDKPDEVGGRITPPKKKQKLDKEDVDSAEKKQKLNEENTPRTSKSNYVVLSVKKKLDYIALLRQVFPILNFNEWVKYEVELNLLGHLDQTDVLRETLHPFLNSYILQLLFHLFYIHHISVDSDADGGSDEDINNEETTGARTGDSKIGDVSVHSSAEGESGEDSNEVERTGTEASDSDTSSEDEQQAPKRTAQKKRKQNEDEMADDDNATSSGPRTRRLRRTSPAETEQISVYELPPLKYDQPSSIETIEFKGFNFLEAHDELNSPHFMGVEGLVKKTFSRIKVPEVRTFWLNFFKPMTPVRNKPDMLNDLVELIIQVHTSQKGI